MSAFGGAATREGPLGPRPERADARTAFSTSSGPIPIHFASSRAYSVVSASSRMPATTGAAAWSAPTRPSAVSRSKAASVRRIMNSNIGFRVSTSCRTASSPRWRRRSQGSSPSGATATKVCAAKRCSSTKARLAAVRPAASPSKVKITSPAAASAESPESPITRRMILMWSTPNAVPHVATAVVTPERCAAITSVYPSTTTTRFCLAMSRFARSSPYRTWDLW